MPSNPRVKYNVRFLKDREIRETFQITLSNRYLQLQDLDTEDEWKEIRKALNNTCEEVLGKWKPEYKEWISPRTLETIEKRKALRKCNRSWTWHQKIESRKLYQEAHKEVRRLIKEDKRNYFSSLAIQAENAAASGNMKDLYDTTKKLAGKYSGTNNQVKDKEGNILTREDDQLQRWVDHFSELLNRLSPTETPSIPEAPSELEVSCERPSKEEIIEVIKQPKSGKAAVPDNILPTALLSRSIHNSRHAVWTLWKDLGRGRNANWVEQKLYHQTPQKRRYERI